MEKAKEQKHKFLNIKSKNKNTLVLKMMGILFILPALVFIVFTTVIPIIWNLFLSFTSWDGNSAIQLVGFQNYIEVFSDSVTLLGFYRSIFIAIISSTIAMVSGLTLALMIYKMGKREGAFFRFVFFTPSMIPLTVIGILFVFILSPDIGLLNNFFGLIGLESLQHAWLSEPNLVMWVIAIIGGWRFTGVIMMLCYTAIYSVPTSLFEAGEIDGATYFMQVRKIILPMIKPTIQLAIMMMLMWSFKTYDIVWSMTKGGPGDFSRTVPIRMLEVSFSYNRFGYGAAIGVLLTIVVSIFIIASQKLTKGDVYEY